MERTVGEGDVHVALPGHLPRFVYGVLRCKETNNNSNGPVCLQLVRHSGFIETPNEDNGRQIYYCAALRSRRLTKC